MNTVSTGDLAQRFALRRQMAELKTDVAALTSELATGVTADVAARVSGDFTALAGLERSLATNGAFAGANNEASVLADTMQQALDIVSQMVSTAAPNLLQAGSLPNPTQLRTAAVDARQNFKTAVAALNVQAGGRTVFAGIETDSAALADAETMFSEIAALTAGETTAAGIETLVNDWFDTAGGGFETTGYLGSTSALGGIDITSTDRVELAVTATDPEIRAALKALVMGALINEGAIAGYNEERGKLAKIAGEQLLNAQSGVLDTRADIGLAQEEIEVAALRNSSEKSALEILRSKMLSVDPYDAQTALEATQTQLETLYAVTARLAELRLVDFLR